jgi:hypothetical protein
VASLFFYERSQRQKMDRISRINPVYGFGHF